MFDDFAALDDLVFSDPCYRTAGVEQQQEDSFLSEKSRVLI